jgi:putative PIN family toxin of toxin-antitoxin system
VTVVLDTNVLVSALINPTGVPAAVLGLVLNGKLTVGYDNRILDEYREALSGQRFHFKKSLILQLLDYIRQAGEFIVAEPLRIASVSEDDRMFYEVAMTGKAAYLVTGNKRRFPSEDIVRTPKEFVDIYLSRE